MKTRTVNIDIPEEILLTLRESDYEFIKDMKKWSALKLYETRKISIGQCSEFAGMPEEDFIKYLGENKISIFQFDNLDELEKDIKNA